MALYHFHVGQIGRRTGASAIAAAAYRAGERLHSERYNEISDYTKKGGVIFSDILLPPQAPTEYADRETLWNAVEKVEKRVDAQLAYSFDIALQDELTIEENMALARQFIEENFLAKGMIVDYAVHNPDREPGGIQNPHFHVMIPIRPIEKDGTWGNKQKKVPVLDEEGNPVWDEKYHRWKFTAVPTTDWGSPETLETWRKNWCDLCNEKFQEKGLTVRLDWRSYERQGVEQLAQVHEGPAVRAMEKKGIPTEKGEYNRWVKSTNALLKSLKEKAEGILDWIRSFNKEWNEAEHEEAEPNLIQVLLDYENMHRIGAEGFSEGARRKANTTTLKDVASAIAYLRDFGITKPSQLEERLTSYRDEVESRNNHMKSISKRMKILKEAIDQVPVYQKNLPVFQEMGNKKYKFKQARDKYKVDHEGELKLFYRARRILKEAGMTEEFSPDVVRSWRKELTSLQSEYEKEYAALKPEREEMQKLSHIQYCVNRVLNPNEKMRKGNQKRIQDL